MKYCYRGGKRRLRRGTLVLLLLLSAVFLVSCVAGSGALWVKGLLGDIASYTTEPVEKTLETDGEISASLCDMVEILTGNSIELQGFRGTSRAVELYRDAILNDMLRDHYALYSGNSVALSAVQQKYPMMVISTLISEEAFENTVFRYFGGTRVKHKSGEVFQYLSRADAYTAPVQAWECGVEIRVERLEETFHTYRMSFTLSDGEETSNLYRAVFVKRDDGSCYFYALETA